MISTISLIPRVGDVAFVADALDCKNGMFQEILIPSVYSSKLLCSTSCDNNQLSQNLRDDLGEKI